MEWGGLIMYSSYENVKSIGKTADGIMSGTRG